MITQIRLVAFIVCLSFSMPSAAAMPSPDAGFDLTAVPFSTVLSLYFKEVSNSPYMLCSDVLADTRMVSIRAKGKTLDGPLFDSLLAAYGYEAKMQKGVIVVCKKSESDPDEINGESLLYKVKNRDSAYLVEFLTPLVRGKFANNRSTGGAFSVGGSVGSVAAGKSGAAQPTPTNSNGTYHSATGDDFIIFTGSAKEVGKVERLLAQLDVPTGEVMIRVYMYEVGRNANDGSALQLFVSALKGRLTAQAGDGGAALGDFVRLKAPSIDFVASALKNDGRFKVVTSPSTRSRSGKSARFVSGAQVAVLGAISTNQSGSTQQSYDRIESGTILEVSPVVHEKSIDVDIFQQVSSFVFAQGGQNTPPTLNKRELRTSLTVQDGELVVIAGLDDSKEESAKAGLSFLPFSLSRSNSNSNSQLVLVMELTRL